MKDTSNDQTTSAAETPREQRPRFRHGIFRKVLISILLISGLPLIVFGIYAFLSINTVGDEIVDHVFETLDQRTRQTMELQAVLTAKTASKFLDQRINDLFDLRELHPTDVNYLQYSTHHESMIWQRAGTNDKPREERRMIPLYREITYIDAAGNEVIKIVDNRVAAPSELSNVADPANTTYRTEEYFHETMSLANGGIYISDLKGWYVTREEQLGAAKTLETAVEGKQFEGVIRLATPVYTEGQPAGMVMLSLDHRHLMEITQHILPNSKQETVFPSYRSGDYAFMFDNRGWIITHPKHWNFPGLDSDGSPVSAYSENTPEEDLRLGRMPFNLDSAAFVHENYPLVAADVRRGNSGSVITRNVGGTNKVMAYAPIRLTHGRYRGSSVFGGITIGAELEGFRGHAVAIASDINRAVGLFRDNILAFILLTFLLAWGMAWFLSRNFTRPILQLTRESEALARGKRTELEPIERADEIGVLSSSFNHMAGELETKRAALLRSMEDLKESKASVEAYAKDLEYEIGVFESIQRISNILGTTSQMDEVLRAILQRSVEGLGFDRAILYLIDEEANCLEYREMYGFTAEEERLARRSRYHLDQADCIETRVVSSGEIGFIKNFDTYKKATPLDHRIRRLSKSKSFVFVPLRAKEKIIGLMGADRLRSGKPIRQRDVSSLQVLANQASRIIENTRLYQQLVGQRNFVRDIIESMLNGVITTDPSGCVTSINRAAEQLLDVDGGNYLNHPVEELVGRYAPLWDVINVALVTRSIRSRHNIELEVGGERRFVSVHVSRLSQGSNTGDSGAIIILQDVTNKKQIDDHLQHVERLASLGRFAAGIAHEIRNPLTGINVFLDDLHDKVATRPQISGVVSRALTEVERLDRLVAEILEYASPSRGDYSTRCMNDVVEATLRFVDKECRDADIRVITDFADDIPPCVMDAEKIRQALLNIILNAIQVMPDGGQLFVGTRFMKGQPWIRTKAGKPDQSDQEWIIVDIGDTGPGIPPEKREQVFEPFYSKRQGGTGLGLSLTHSIISEHGGDIVIDKFQNQGALFSLILPVSRSALESRAINRNESTS